MVFVSVVSPTTTVCGSFVGAVGGGGGGGASSVVLQSIVSRKRYQVLVYFFFSGVPGLSCSIGCVKTHSGKPEVADTGNRVYNTGTDGGIKSNEYTHMYVMYKTGYRYLTYISSIFRYYRTETVCELFSLVILKKCHNCSVALFPCA